MPLSGHLYLKQSLQYHHDECINVWHGLCMQRPDLWLDNEEKQNSQGQHLEFSDNMPL